MQRTSARWRWRLALVAAVAWLCVGLTPASAQPAQKPPNPEEILGQIPVYAQNATRPLPKISIVPSLSSAIEDVTLSSVVRRDLQLSGEFEILPDSKAPEGVYLADTPVDVEAWKKTGAQAVIKIAGMPHSKGFAELRAEVYYLKYGELPIMEKRLKVPDTNLRLEAHRVADLIIGALTGTNGSFASHMTFASGTGNLRRIYTIDADGHDAKAVSPPNRVALAPAYGPNDELYYSASVNKDEYKVYTLDKGPLPLAVRGSVYGLAWNKTRDKVAVSIGVADTIRVFTGPNLGSLQVASPIGMALRPQWTPTGKLAFAGEGKWSQQIFVDGKAISPSGLWASAPTFCRHPDGIKAVFMVGAGKATDLVASGETGGGLVRLTQGMGSNRYPACSPDGRLVAFFSTRTSGEGPGLYIMRLAGGRAQRVSTLLGDSLRWAPRPPGKAVELPVPKREPKEKDDDEADEASDKAKPSDSDKG